MKRNWFDKKVLILGLSKSGISAAKYLNEQGADCFVSESKPLDDKNTQTVKELEAIGIRVEAGVHSDEFIEDAYVAITSPGIPPHAEIFKRLKEKNISVISEVELAYLETGTPFIAITGTNGKTTTTTLVEHILSAQHIAPACGNIGLPPTSLISKKNDYLVCEVSSFQLEMSPTFKPQIACFLNFTPDHVDWHQGLENYFNAKAKMFANYKKPAFAVFNALDEKVFEFAQAYSDEKFFFGKEFESNCSYVKDGVVFFKSKKEEEIIKVDEIPLVGEHNLQNVMCAIIVAKIVGISNEEIKERIMSFKAVEHRIEYVATIGEKAFYNDSKATNPEAAIFALKSFNGKSMTLIAGGKDKMTDLTDFCKVINETVKTVILIGEATERFKENMIANGFTNIILESTMESAIDKSIELDNQVVLLSPACSSFDMYDNYEQRGEAFKKYVLSKV